MLKSTLTGAAILIGLAAEPAVAADIDCGRAELVKSATLPIEACIDPSVWQAGQPAGAQEFVYFTRDGRAGLAIVTEKPAVDMTAYRAAILGSAGRQSGDGGSAAAYEDGSGDINGKPWQWMHYNVTGQGNAFEFLNYYYSEAGLGSVQFIFWSLPGDAAMVGTDLAGKVMPTVTVIE